MNLPVVALYMMQLAFLLPMKCVVGLIDIPCSGTAYQNASAEDGTLFKHKTPCQATLN
jgi:hypothetical protein